MAPLDGISVLDLTHLLPGELCSTILCDMGARVLRIESLQLTLGRMLPPIVNGESLYFWSLHRNKQRIGLNLKSSKGLEIVHQMLNQYDVLLENFRPGVMSRLGLGYETVKELNPRLIYCSISGYGQNGSWSQRPGHDLNFAAESGIIDLNGRVGSKPLLPPVLVSDYTAAMYAALGISAQLYERERTNLGRHIDISMFESALSTMGIMGTSKLYEELHQDVKPYVYPRELPNYTVYECKDKRYLAVASLEPQFWKTFCEKIGHPELTQSVISPQDEALKALLESTIKAKDLAEWMEIFAGSDCCVSPVNTVSEALHSIPAVERGVVHNLIHPTLGRVPQVTSPLLSQIDESTAYDDRKNQTLNVLRDLGYAEDDLVSMQNDKVIQ